MNEINKLTKRIGRLIVVVMLGSIIAKAIHPFILSDSLIFDLVSFMSVAGLCAFAWDNILSDLYKDER